MSSRIMTTGLNSALCLMASLVNRFIRAKEIPPGSGNWYDYEVMTTHEGSHVRQKVIKSLGRSGSHSMENSLSFLPIFHKFRRVLFFKTAFYAIIIPCNLSLTESTPNLGVSF